jgi:hypothetical protein
MFKNYFDLYVWCYLRGRDCLTHQLQLKLHNIFVLTLSASKQSQCIIGQNQKKRDKSVLPDVKFMVADIAEIHVLILCGWKDVCRAKEK